MSDLSEIRRKTVVLVVVVICSNVLGNLLLSIGMHNVGATVADSPVPYLKALLNPWVISGIGLLGLWLFSNLSLLSWADLSYVLPVTAIGYVLSALLGGVVLKEDVSVIRWAG